MGETICPRFCKPRGCGHRFCSLLITVYTFITFAYTRRVTGNSKPFIPSSVHYKVYKVNCNIIFVMLLSHNIRYKNRTHMSRFSLTTRIFYIGTTTTFKHWAESLSSSTLSCTFSKEFDIWSGPPKHAWPALKCRFSIHILNNNGGLKD